MNTGPSLYVLTALGLAALGGVLVIAAVLKGLTNAAAP